MDLKPIGERAQIFIFGGGDGTVLIVTAHGFSKIKPFGPETLRELQAVSELVRIGDGQEFGEVAARLSSNALAHISERTGVTDASVIFMDGDDITYCGNGLRPVPIHYGGGGGGGQEAAG
jgi:hypothetical protein